MVQKFVIVGNRREFFQCAVRIKHSLADIKGYWATNLEHVAVWHLSLQTDNCFPMRFGKISMTVCEKCFLELCTSTDSLKYFNTSSLLEGIGSIRRLTREPVLLISCKRNKATMVVAYKLVYNGGGLRRYAAILVAYKAIVIREGLPRFKHTTLALIRCDISLYIPIFPAVLHSVVVQESIQFIPLLVLPVLRGSQYEILIKDNKVRCNPWLKREFVISISTLLSALESMGWSIS